jgi:hypothetical protein
MTTEEFSVLHCLEALGSKQGLIPRGVSVRYLVEILYDEGMGMFDSHEITTILVAMRRRKLVVSRPGGDGALWLVTLYGSNIVTA